MVADHIRPDADGVVFERLPDFSIRRGRVQEGVQRLAHPQTTAVSSCAVADSPRWRPCSQTNALSCGSSSTLRNKSPNWVWPSSSRFLTDIGEEVLVTGQHRDRLFQGSHKLIGGLRHGPAKIAHDGAGEAEGCRNALDSGKSLQNENETIAPLPNRNLQKNRL